MPFHSLPYPHISRPAAGASWLLRLMMAVVLGGLLLWAFACSATHDSNGHTHGRTPVSAGQLPLAAEAVERETSQGAHPHPGSGCAPYAAIHVLPQARQLLSGSASLTAFAAVAVGVIATVAVRQPAARPNGARSWIRRYGRTRLSVVCRWRI
jgi:hypothetical protein